VSDRIVVTGLGTAGPWGLGHGELLKSWRGGGPLPREVDRSAGFHRAHGARTALLAAGIDLSAYLSSGQARRMSPPARLAMAAARLALADAGLTSVARGEMERTAIVVGTAFGPSSVTEQMLRQILESGPETTSPALFTESVASAPASQVALALGARGPNLAVTGREASDLLAVGEARRLLATDAAERVLVLVVDEMIPLLHAVLDRFRALAEADADGRERARPLSADRDGVLAAEGATALLLEVEETAVRRGVTPWGGLAAAIRGFDRTASPSDWGSGGADLAATLGGGLERAGIDRADFELIVSGAAGASKGDRAEAELLAALFVGDPPPIVAPKAALGAWGGGFLAAAVLAAAGSLPSDSAIASCDPSFGLRLAAGELEARPRRTLVSSLGSGGAAAWIVLDGGQPHPRSAV